jgi:hypothetical protein
VQAQTTASIGGGKRLRGVSRRRRTLAILGVGLAAVIGTSCAPPAGVLSVTHVVDGDTVDVSSGERVRLVGIDTPELGQCGYQEATNLMRQLVAGKAVTLVAIPGRDDHDRYGRLLRYVRVGRADVGLAEISYGLAVARYDSRDGYGSHPMQPAYLAADAAHASPICGPSPAPPSGGGGGTDPQFPTCKAANAAGYGPYASGVDPEYAWYTDADHDGIVCE